MKNVIRILLVIGILFITNSLLAQNKTMYKSGFDTKEIVSHAQIFYHLDHKNMQIIYRNLSDSSITNKSKPQSYHAG